MYIHVISQSIENMETYKMGMHIIYRGPCPHVTISI